MKKRTAVWIQVTFAYLTPFILLTVSFFTPRWYVEDDERKGLFYQCNGDGCTLKVLDQATIGLEGTSLVIAFLACVHGVVSVCAYGPDHLDFIMNVEGICFLCNCMMFYCCSICLYPITGILILSGCMRYGTVFHTETLGVSFYLCAVAGCLHFLMMFVACCDACCKKKDDDFVFKTFMEELYEDAV